MSGFNSIHKTAKTKWSVLWFPASAKLTLPCVFSQRPLIISISTNKSRAGGTERFGRAQVSIVSVFTLAEICAVARAPFVLWGFTGSSSSTALLVSWCHSAPYALPNTSSAQSSLTDFIKTALKQKRQCLTFQVHLLLFGSSTSHLEKVTKKCNCHGQHTLNSMSL